jgi:Pentapeptide repeats (8 copies)
VLWPLTDALASHDIGYVATAATRTLRLQSARESVRTQLLTLGAGLGALGALVFTSQNYLLSRQGQVTDRYSRAIEQLGSDKLDVRIGGIYALERVARDSPKRDHPPVMEVLAAFIREHSREPLSGPAVGRRHSSRRTEAGLRPAAAAAYPPAPATPPIGPLRPEVHAAISVIGRRNAKADVRTLDLASTALQQADLAGANLAGANLAGANLAGANLADANLALADRAGANLDRADLTRAQWPSEAPLPGGWILDEEHGCLMPAPERGEGG